MGCKAAGARRGRGKRRQNKAPGKTSLQLAVEALLTGLASCSRSSSGVCGSSPSFTTSAGKPRLRDSGAPQLERTCSGLTPRSGMLRLDLGDLLLRVVLPARFERVSQESAGDSPRRADARLPLLPLRL